MEGLLLDQEETSEEGVYQEPEAVFEYFHAAFVV